MCKVCQRTVGADALWSAHATSKPHKEAVEKLRTSLQGSGAVDDRSSSSAQQQLSVHRLPESRVTSSNNTAAATSGATRAAHSAFSVASVPDGVLESSRNASLAAPTSQTIAASSAVTGGAASNAQIPSRASSSATSSTALPAGFFDDTDRDAKARGLDPAAVERAAGDAAFSDFMRWAKGVEAAEGDRQADEQERYEDRQVLGRAEDALYRARLDIVKLERQRALAGGAGSSAASSAAAVIEDGDDDAGVAGSELLGAISFLTAPDEGASRLTKAEIGAIAVARRRRALFGPGAADDGDEGRHQASHVGTKRGRDRGDDAPAGSAAGVAATNESHGFTNEAAVDDDSDDGGLESLVDWRRKRI